jgi:hypothetical protein
VTFSQASCEGGTERSIWSRKRRLRQGLPRSTAQRITGPEAVPSGPRAGKESSLGGSVCRWIHPAGFAGFRWGIHRATTNRAQALEYDSELHAGQPAGFRLDSPVKKPPASELARSAPPPTDRAREEPWHARADHRNRRQKRVNSLRSVMARSPWPRGSWSVRRRRPKLCERCRHRAHQAPPVFVQTSNLTFDRGIPVIRNKPIGAAFQPQPTGCYASESPPVVPAGGNDPLKNRRPVLRFLTVRQ